MALTTLLEVTEHLDFNRLQIKKEDVEYIGAYEGFGKSQWTEGNTRIGKHEILDSNGKSVGCVYSSLEDDWDIIEAKIFEFIAKM